MKINKTHLTLNIKGKNWHFITIADKSFDKKFPNEEGEEGETAAVTKSDENTVYIRKTKVTIPVIRHEIFHVIVFSSLIESSSLTKDQMEELSAEIVGEHASEIVLWAEQVMNFYTQRS